MGIKFCQTCNGLIGKSDNKTLCLSCGNVYEEELSLSSTESLVKKREVSIINEKESETLPKIYHKCLKCGSEEAYFWHMITTASDEADTLFFRCTNCNHTVQKGGQRGGR